MKNPAAPLMVGAVAALLSGCMDTRSISRSGYEAYGHAYGREQELTEADVLAVRQNKPITDAQIRAALADSSRVNLSRGKPLVVVQSGAGTPETSMLRALESTFSVVPFSGLRSEAGGADYSLKLRLAAAQGGCPRILVYWGTLETERVDRATKVVSWVPIADSFVPDETQQMRLRMKGAIIDVASGKWTMVTSTEVGDKRLSADIVRAQSDQWQVRKLKAAGYVAFVDKLVREHTR